MSLNLSPGQEGALEAIREWYEETDGQVFRMFGPAGTGKTTIARLVPEILGLDTFYFAAFSGKAAQVLRSKGCQPASTLHSLTYGAPINLQAEKTRLEKKIEQEQAVLDTGGVKLLDVDRETLRSRISAMIDEVQNLTRQIRMSGPFVWPKREDSPLVTAQLLIADEVSMVNDRMAGDILDFGTRVLVLGDPEQLPPVGGDGYFTRSAPDVALTEVHRQALDSPVLALATRVREGGAILPQEYASGSAVDYTAFDQILCWRRATRWGAINYVRKELGRPYGEVVPGDKIMNLANNKDMGVFNGQTFIVDEVQPGRTDEEVLLVVHGESDPDVTSQMFCWKFGFTQEGEAGAEKQRLGWRGDTAFVTFAQALTVHKAQGSEWPNVLLVDETRAMYGMESKRNGWMAAESAVRRWLYTGITRAAEAVTLVAK